MNWVSYGLTLLLTYSIYLIVATGLNFIVGYCGRLTLAQGALYGAGSYAYALVALRGEGAAWPYLGFFGAVSTGALLSLALALPERRLRGDFFVIGTLALQAIVFGTLKNWHAPGEPLGSWRNLTNGTAGISGVPRPAVFASLLALTVLATLLAIVVVLATRILVRAPWGRLLRASRDDRLAAEGLGKPVLVVRLQAFSIAGGTAALGGALYAAYASYVSPDLGAVHVSVTFLSMVLIGGRGTIGGPAMGAAVLLAIEELLRGLRVAEVLRATFPGVGRFAFTDANLQMLAYGLLLLVLLRHRPHGLAGERATARAE